MIRSALAISIVLFVVPGCGEDDDECNGFGCPADGVTAADDGASTSASDPSSDPTAADDADDDDTASSTSVSTTTPDPTTTGASADATDTTSPSESTSHVDDESTTAACEGADCPALAECFGIGIWESCAQYCEALEATCVEAGCDGATVVYYGDANACIAMRSNGESDQACDAAFDEQGGGVSFGRCCCNA